MSPTDAVAYGKLKARATKLEGFLVRIIRGHYFSDGELHNATLAARDYLFPHMVDCPITAFADYVREENKSHG